MKKKKKTKRKLKHYFHGLTNKCSDLKENEENIFFKALKIAVLTSEKFK